MSLKVRNIKSIVEDFAPTKLKVSYDNIGLMVGDLDKEVTNLLVALDCTLDVISEAVEKNCNLIYTHHPLLFIKPSSITEETLTGKKVIQLIKNDISLYSAHTNLDSTEGGINDTIMKILGLHNYVTMEPSENREAKDAKSGIGRFAKLEQAISLKELCNKVKNSLGLSYLRYAGEEDMIISKVAVINGSGQDYFSLAKRMGADCIITGDTTYHFVSDYSEEGIGVIDPGHFGSEWPAFKALAYILEKKLEGMGYNNKVIISEKAVEPYKLG
jgi:dinuclear metal center YbgI/SA1388 family protein